MNRKHIGDCVFSLLLVPPFKEKVPLTLWLKLWTSSASSMVDNLKAFCESVCLYAEFGFTENDKVHVRCGDDLDWILLMFKTRWRRKNWGEHDWSGGRSHHHQCPGSRDRGSSQCCICREYLIQGQLFSNILQSVSCIMNWSGHLWRFRIHMN